MSRRVYLLFPPRGHEPPPTLRDRLNPHLSLKRRRFPVPRIHMPNARMSLWTQSVHSFSSLCVYKSSEVLPSSTAPSKCQCIINSILSSTAPSPRHGASICPSIRAAPQHLGSTVHDFALNYLPRNHQQRSRHGSYSRDSDARPFGTIRNDYPSVKLPFHGVVDTSSFYGVSRCNII